MKAKYKELFDLAYEFQKKNELDKAQEIYTTLLSVNPEDYNVLNLLGMLYMSKKDYEQSISYLSKAVVLYSSAYFLSNLAKAYFLNKQYDVAVNLYIQALDIEVNDDIYYSLGLAYKSLKKYDQAILYYNKAIDLNPDHYNAYYNIALLYKDINKPELAIDYCLRARLINDNDVDLYSLLSSLYESVNDYEKSILSLEKAVILNPMNPFFFYNLGVLYSKLNNTANSIKNYLKVLEIIPYDVDTVVNLANLYREIDKEIALKYALIAYDKDKKEPNVVLVLSQIYKDFYDNEKSLEILNNYLSESNKNPEVFYQIASNNMDLCNYEIALDYYEKSLLIEPENLSYLKGKAIALKYLGKEETAFNILNDIYQKDGKSHSTAVSIGMFYLKNRDFEKGMEYYSNRSKDTKLAKLFDAKIWEKSIDITGKNILLYSDCGLGDTIMFARYMPLLKEKVNSLTLQTDVEIVPLLKQSYKDINIISKSEERTEYDLIIPMMDISYALNSNFEEIPFKTSYLSADLEKISKFKQLDIFNNSNLKVGICYQGNKRVLKNRSIDINKLSELFGIDNVTFYSFQINEKDDRLIDLSEYISDYSDTSALLNCIDVLVTIDSSIVHVAGALGIKTYLMLPKTAEWRWFDDNIKSSWYDSVKIFKQSEPNNWEDVVAQVKEEIVKNAIK